MSHEFPDDVRRKISSDPEFVKNLAEAIRAVYDRKISLAQIARNSTPEHFSQREFANNIISALEASWSDMKALVDILEAISLDNDVKVRQIDKRVQRGEKITHWWDRVFSDQSKRADRKNE